MLPKRGEIWLVNLDPTGTVRASAIINSQFSINLIYPTINIPFDRWTILSRSYNRGMPIEQLEEHTRANTGQYLVK
jgi:hypothetical protein